MGTFAFIVIGSLSFSSLVLILYYIFCGERGKQNMVNHIIEVIKAFREKKI